METTWKRVLACGDRQIDWMLPWAGIGLWSVGGPAGPVSSLLRLGAVVLVAAILWHDGRLVRRGRSLVSLGAEAAIWGLAMLVTMALVESTPADWAIAAVSLALWFALGLRRNRGADARGER